jgi:hypothetical protein
MKLAVLAATARLPAASAKRLEASSHKRLVVAEVFDDLRELRSETAELLSVEAWLVSRSRHGNLFLSFLALSFTVDRLS